MFRNWVDSDAAAVQRVLSGDREVFARLVERHERAVMGVALASCRNYHEAQDLAQEAFLRAFRDLRSLRQPERFAPWLVQITRNLAVDHARRAAMRLSTPLDAPDGLQPEDAEGRELHELLREEVLRLPQAFREAVILHYFSGKTAAEVGGLLGISRAAAHKRIQRGRQMLGASMDRHFQEALRKPHAKGALVGPVMGAVAGISMAGKASASPAPLAAGGMAATLVLLLKALAPLALAFCGALAWWWPESKGTEDSPSTVRPAAAALAAQPDPVPTGTAKDNQEPPSPAGQKSDAEASPATILAGSEEPAILGKVSDTLNRPISDVHVIGYSTDGFHAEGQTNEKGEYRLEWLGEREYTLRVRAPGFRPQTRVAQAPARADFRLESGPLIACKLLDAKTRLPIAGASVSLREVEAISNPSGHVDLAPPAAAYVAFSSEEVEILAAGYQNTYLKVEEMLPAGNEERTEISLPPLSVVRGRVLNGEDEVLPGVQVYVLEPGLRRVGKTDDSGAFEVAHLDAWPEKLYFSRFPIFRYSTADATEETLLRECKALGIASLALPAAPPTSVLDYRVVMEGGASLRGTIAFAGDGPEASPDGQRADLQITYDGQQEWGGFTGMGLLELGAQLQQSVQNGEYVFPLLPPGEVAVLLSYNESRNQNRFAFREISKRATLTDGASTTVDFADAHVLLHGEVRFEGRPVDSGLLSLETIRGTTRESTHARVSKEGDYEVMVLAGARLKLTASVVVGIEQVQRKDVEGVTLPASGEMKLNIDITGGGHAN